MTLLSCDKNPPCPSFLSENSCFTNGNSLLKLSQGNQQKNQGKAQKPRETALPFRAPKTSEDLHKPQPYCSQQRSTAMHTNWSTEVHLLFLTAVHLAFPMQYFSQFLLFVLQYFLNRRRNRKEFPERGLTLTMFTQKALPQQPNRKWLLSLSPCKALQNPAANHRPETVHSRTEAGVTGKFLETERGRTSLQLSMRNKDIATATIFEFNLSLRRRCPSFLALAQGANCLNQWSSMSEDNAFLMFRFGKELTENKHVAAKNQGGVTTETSREQAREHDHTNSDYNGN